MQGVESPLKDLAERAAAMHSPGIGLAAVAELRRQLDALEDAHVDNALRGDWSWGKIAGALGVTRQAAHKKHTRRRRANGRPPKKSGDDSKLVVTGEARRAVELARREARALRSQAI